MVQYADMNMYGRLQMCPWNFLLSSGESWFLCCLFFFPHAVLNINDDYWDRSIVLTF